MITFILKSTISFFVIYLIYKIFLAKENIPVFKRYFLLFGILFSIIISMVNIETNAQITDVINRITVNSQIQEITSSNPVILFSEYKSQHYLEWFLSIIYIKRFFYGTYFLIFSLLLFRYVLNLIRLIRLGKENQFHTFEGYKIVILEKDTSPFSFLKTIFLSKKDYNGGNIKKEILIHELTHIKQNHSIDILLIEFLQVIFWFNPFIRLYKKEIRLNHECLADKEVIDNGIEIDNYQKFILNFALRNNSSYLASGLDYLFIKKRFIMLAKEKSSKRAFIKTAIIVPIIALLAIVITFNQEAKAMVNLNELTEWWQPILQKHNIKEIKAYNNFENVFEMGEQNSIYDDVVKLSNATVIIKGNDNDYMFIQGALIEHNLSNGMLKIISGTLNIYKMDSADISQPLSSASGNEFQINLKSPMIFH